MCVCVRVCVCVCVCVWWVSGWVVGGGMCVLVCVAYGLVSVCLP